MPISEISNSNTVPAISGRNTAGGDGVTGVGRRGVVGTSDEFQGVYGKSRDNAGVVGESQAMHAVFGITHSTFAGVAGFSDVAGGTGVFGECKNGIGVKGVSETGDGVFATGRRGVVGESETFQGVYGKSRDNAGVVGESQAMHAVFGITHSTFAGVAGFSDVAGGTGVFGESNDGVGVHAKGGRLAGLFDGNVHINGKLFVTVDVELANGDCAEEFRVAEPEVAEPGTVMVLGEEETLHCCCEEYDRRVAGVVSGAGSYRPAIVLDRQNDNADRRPLAMVGKVYCKVDADYSPIEVGDLLTTSTSPGHAMKATDQARAFGAVIGKALRRHQCGKGLIPILIALQ